MWHNAAVKWHNFLSETIFRHVRFENIRTEGSCKLKIKIVKLEIMLISTGEYYEGEVDKREIAVMEKYKLT